MIRYIKEDFTHHEGIEVPKGTEVFVIASSLNEKYSSGVVAHVILFVGELMEMKIDASLLENSI